MTNETTTRKRFFETASYASSERTFEFMLDWRDLRRKLGHLREKCMYVINDVIIDSHQNQMILYCMWSDNGSIPIISDIFCLIGIQCISDTASFTKTEKLCIIVTGKRRIDHWGRGIFGVFLRMVYLLRIDIL